MILVADSGSTKTRWALIPPDGEPLLCETEGLNPRFTTDNAFAAACLAVKTQIAGMQGPLDALYFYGAGCGTQQACNRVKTLLSAAFESSNTRVEGDLLGACRALCGQEAGWAGILGTGSNACHYNGLRIDRQSASTGFILGDEGSGNHIGRLLLKNYMEGTLPEHLRSLFHEFCPLSSEELLNRLYHHPNANRFLASLVPFAAANRQDPWVERMLAECFEAFFTHLANSLGISGEEINMAGGVAAQFKDEMTAAATHCGFTIGNVVNDPLPALIAFHKINM